MTPKIKITSTHILVKPTINSLPNCASLEKNLFFLIDLKNNLQHF